MLFSTVYCIPQAYKLIRRYLGLEWSLKNYHVQHCDSTEQPSQKLVLSIIKIVEITHQVMPSFD